MSDKDTGRYASLQSAEGQRQLKAAKKKDRRQRTIREKQKEKEDFALKIRTLPPLGKVGKRERKAKVKAKKAIDKYVKSTKKQSTWIRALKEANKGKPNWCVPKKGSELYNNVKRIQSRLDKKDSGVTRTNRAGLKKVKRGKKISKKQKKALEEIRERRRKKQIEI